MSTYLAGNPRIAAGSLVEVYWKKDLLACGFFDPHSPLRVRDGLGLVVDALGCRSGREE